MTLSEEFRSRNFSKSFHYQAPKNDQALTDCLPQGIYGQWFVLFPLYACRSNRYHQAFAFAIMTRDGQSPRRTWRIWKIRLPKLSRLNGVSGDLDAVNWAIYWQIASNKHELNSLLYWRLNVDLGLECYAYFCVLRWALPIFSLP